MPHLTDDAFVLRHWEFSETSQTVALFCRGHGVLRGLAKGSRRERAAFSGGFETLDKGQILAIVKPTTDLATLTEWDLRRRPAALSRSLAAHYAALYWADLVHHMCTDSDPHPRLWDALDQSLLALERAEDPGALTLRFQWAALDDTGHRPDLALPTGAATTARTLGFDARLGRIVPDPGASVSPDPAVWRIRAETLHAIRAAAGAPTTESGPRPAADGEGSALPRPPSREAGWRITDRANRFLASLIRWILGRETPTMAALFGPPGFGEERPAPSEHARRTRR